MLESAFVALNSIRKSKALLSLEKPDLNLNDDVMRLDSLFFYVVCLSMRCGVVSREESNPNPLSTRRSREMNFFKRRTTNSS